NELEAAGNTLSTATRFSLATKAFTHTAAYDGAIANWFGAHGVDGGGMFPPHVNQDVDKLQELRYGEHPHQRAALYRDANPPAGRMVTLRHLQRKAMTFNNVVDADAAWECVKSLADFAPSVACVIVKHANPCGVALGATSLEAYRNALATDRVSAFGGIIAFN